MKLPETGVVIDVYKIRVPYNKRELVTRLWNEIDELEIPTEKRIQLKEHGLRQGRLASKVPPTLVQLLELKEISSQKQFETQMTLKDAMAGEPLCKRATATMVEGQSAEFRTCDPLPVLPVLASVDGDLIGREYQNAVGVLQISTEEMADGSVMLTTVPEIHYGTETGRITQIGGAMTRQTVRPKLLFDQLTLKTNLLLGQWVIIGPTMEKNGGFGNHILSQNEGSPEQILMAIRLVQTKKDGIHDRNDIPVLKLSNDHDNHSPKDNETEDEPEIADVFPEDFAKQELGL